MEMAQLEQMVTWLDQQRRRADQDLRQLEQRLTAQMGVMEEQARRIQQLEAELAAARAQLAEQTSLHEALENLRNEVRAMIDRLEEERLARERDQERLRAAEREKWARDLADLRKELERISPLEEGIVQQKSETRRLNEVVLQLREQVIEAQRQAEEAVRTSALLKEQRTQDHKRIGQLQGETVELFRRLESTIGKLTLLEQKLQRQETAIKQIAQTSEEVKAAQDVFLEEIRRVDVDRQHKMNAWEKTFAEIQEQIAQFKEHMERFQVQYDKAGQAVKTIEGIQAALQRDIHEIREAQRVAEEHLRAAMRDFETEQEKRWKKQLLEWEYKFQEQERQVTALKGLLEAAQKQLALHTELLDVLWRLQEEWGSHQLGAAQGVLQLIEEMAERRERALKTYQRVAASRKAAPAAESSS